MIPLRHRLAGLAFPPGERRDELIGTLADAEEDGTRAPGPLESVNILWHGLRARLGRPGNHLVVPFALVMMLLGAFAGGAVATRLAWAFVPPLPTGDRAAEISGTVFPGLTVYGGGEAADFATEPSAEGGPVYGFVDHTVTHTAETRNTVDYGRDARARLTAAGWETHDLYDQERGGDYQFWAQRDGLILRFTIVYRAGVPSYDSDGGATYTLSRTPPAWIWWAAPAGAPIGALVTYLVFGWVSRRTDREDSPIVVLAMIYLFPLLFTSLFVWEGVKEWWRPGVASPQLRPFWAPTLYDFAAFPTMLLLFMTAGAILLAAAHRPYPLAGLWSLLSRRPRLRRAGTAAVALLLLVPAGVWAVGALRPCGPDGLPVQPTATEARLSLQARVYVTAESTQDERNLLQAAIGRTGGSPGWHGDQRGELPIGCGAPVPWFDVAFTGPGMFGRLQAEVTGLPGVLAVHRAA
ncbi:hypothetical protein [Catenuloplanes japonicus]|uniref:hypothetical protein n=1 Tax=Catenuloplanes japonicus TaxID=33876 RepID=UPI000525D0DF|nr:hypothetical protein [Catenuloplanes japonicus]